MVRKPCTTLRGVVALALVAVVAPAAMADSTTVSYQGMLRDATLSPVPDGGYPMDFSIYDAETGGSPLWGPEAYASVAVTNGMFSVYLGSIEPLDAVFADHGALWLEISADTGTGMEAYAPRVPLASVPYAQYTARAGDADTLDGLDASAFAGASHTHDGSHITTGTVNTDRLNVGTLSTQVARGSHTHNTLTGPGGAPANALVVDGAGNVGVGTATPGRRLEVNGALGFTGGSAISGQSTGQMTRTPRVIHSIDPRGGCPPAHAANTAFWTVSFTLAQPAAVVITGTMACRYIGRADLHLYVNGTAMTRTFVYSDVNDFEAGHVAWSGVLGAGTHNVWMRSPTADVWGCANTPPSGYMDIIIFE